MIVTGTEAVATTIGTTSHTDIVAVANTCLIVKILPVGIDIVAFIQRILILTSILTELAECGTVHHRILLEWLLNTYITIISYLGRCALTTLYSGDDDHTVGTTRTIDSGCRSILQDIQ